MRWVVNYTAARLASSYPLFIQHVYCTDTCMSKCDSITQNLFVDKMSFITIYALEVRFMHWCIERPKYSVTEDLPWRWLGDGGDEPDPTTQLFVWCHSLWKQRSRYREKKKITSTKCSRHAYLIQELFLAAARMFRAETWLKPSLSCSYVHSLLLRGADHYSNSNWEWGQKRPPPQKKIYIYIYPRSQLFFTLR